MSEDWQPGDRAYCKHARAALGCVETGRIYTVARVIPVPNHVGCGLELKEVSPPAPMVGFWDGRFIRLPRGVSSLSQIDAARAAMQVSA